MPKKTHRVTERPRRKPTNLGVREDLLQDARRLGINLSRLLERSLEEETRQARQVAWLDENREALEDYNRRIDRSGVFSDGLRGF
jgi:antitoxin CcdA